MEKIEENWHFIDLGRLFSKEKISFIESLERCSEKFTEVVVRDKNLKFFTPNKRLLWIAAGLEYIEPELLSYIDEFAPDDVFYDVGASNGPFSIYAAVKGMQVIAIEPEAQNYGILEMNHYLNRENMRHALLSFNIALADKTGLGKMYCAEYEGGGHMKILDKPIKVQEEKEFKPAHIQNIIKYSLDELIEKFELPFPQHIKIDIDGSEGDFLKGAMSTLKCGGLNSIFIEIDDPSNNNRGFVKQLEKCGFKLTKLVQVQRYKGLFNCVFKRSV